MFESEVRVVSLRIRACEIFVSGKSGLERPTGTFLKRIKIKRA